MEELVASGTEGGVVLVDTSGGACCRSATEGGVVPVDITGEMASA